MAYRDEIVLFARGGDGAGADIPDAGGDAVERVLVVQPRGRVRRIVVEIDITHPSVSDLVVSLAAPSGPRVLLYNQQAASGVTHALRFDSETFARLAPLLGEPSRGRWQLSVRDTVGADTGTLDRWSLAVEIAQRRG